MTDPLQFPSTTPRHDLPLLFAGQAQKEFFVNEAFSRCDALLHPRIAGEAGAAPVDAPEGECWLVSAAATGDFAGHADSLAIRRSGAWEFLAPRDGMRVFDGSARQFLHFDGSWRRATGAAGPTGGQIVDAEARASIAAIMAILQQCGILPQT